MKRQSFIRFALVSLALSATASVQAQTTKFRFAHAGPETASQHVAALEFANLVKERSNGTVEVTVFPGSQLGNDSTVIGAVRGGTIDIMMAGSGNFAGMAPEMDVLDIPFLFRDPAHAYATVDGKIGQRLASALESKNLKQLAYWEVGFRSITTKNRPVNKPEDVKGLKLRTTPNPTHIQAWKLLGSNPIPMPLGELYSALESGAVDAQEHPVDITYAAKFYEVQKHLTMSRHAFTAMPVVMNKKKFDALKPEQQQALLSAAEDAKLLQRQINQKNEAGILADLRKHGMSVIEKFDPEPFRAIVSEPLRKSFVEKHGPDLLNAVEAIK